MRTVTKEYEVYEFDELSESVQQDIINNWRVHDIYFWDEEWQQSLNEFLIRMNLNPRYVDWQVDPFGHSYIRYLPPDPLNFSWVDEDGEGYGWHSLDYWKKVLEACRACSLTGYCGDGDFVEPIERAIEDYPRNKNMRAADLLQECLDAWLKGYRADMEFWHSEEAIREDIEVNGPEFLANGKPFRGD